jgi:hypothetical protein
MLYYPPPFFWRAREDDGCRSPKMVAFWEYYCITRNCMILGIIIC